MLLAQHYQEDFVDLYSSLVEEYLLSNDKELKDLFKRVFKETRSLVREEKSYYQISSDIFPIVSFLEEKNPDFFKSVNLQGFCQKDVRKIKDMLKK